MGPGGRGPERGAAGADRDVARGPARDRRADRRDAAVHRGASSLRAPRVAPPAGLAGLCSTAPLDRAGHTYGKSFRDVVRGFASRLREPAGRRGVSERRGRRRGACSTWCSTPASRRSRTAAGRASSVASRRPPADAVRGRRVDRPRAARSRASRIDRTSRAARIQAGVLGPALEDQLRPHGLTLRHFPQSFEFSSLGGWIATRSGRPLRDALHPHRRVRRGASGRDADRARRDPAAACVGCRAESRSAVHRLGGDPRHHHRGVDAAAGTADLSRLRVGDVPERSPPAPPPCTRSARAGCIPPTAVCSIRARR